MKLSLLAPNDGARLKAVHSLHPAALPEQLARAQGVHQACRESGLGGHLYTFVY